MKRLLMSLVLAAVSVSSAAHAKEGEWEQAASADIDGRKLKVYAREKDGSDVKETRGLGSFAAAPWIIKNVIDDVGNYKNFMPYTKESLVVKQGDGFIISYQRVSTPVVEDRDYNIKITDESREDASGKVIWKNRWTVTSGGIPVKEGVTRITANDGYWQLEDAADGGTKVTYYVNTNPGGGLPSFVVNMANSTAVGELFKAVAKASKDPRYAKTKPKPRSSEKKPEAPVPTISAPAAGTTP